MSHRALVVAYALTFVTVAIILVIRGPIRDAAWAEPCRDLRAGESIPGHWNTIEPCKERP